jgi:G:T/U-mismatch repair DNA glycosylase
MSQPPIDQRLLDQLFEPAFLDPLLDLAGHSRPAAEGYEARQIKRRRASKTEIEERRGSLFKIVQAMRPMTVRQVFYQATIRNIVEKIEAGYAKVQTDLVVMRKNGTLPYGWLADNTRWQRKPRTFGSIQEALDDTARVYRKALWNDARAYVEIWLEKDALAGVVYPITSIYDVPLMVARGYASLSFLHGAAEYINDLDVPAYIYHLGDFDPSGVNAGETIERTLREMAPDAEIHFERIAVNPDQIAAWNLPTRPTKATDSRSKGFGNISVELDAIEPNQLRAVVQAAIERHLPQRQFEVLKAAEESERTLIRQLVNGLAAP